MRQAVQDFKNLQAWAPGLPIQMTEGNSKSKGGIKGVSDAFASALWAADFAFELAAAGARGCCRSRAAHGARAPAWSGDRRSHTFHACACSEAAQCACAACVCQAPFHTPRSPRPPTGAPAVLLHWRTGGSPDGRPALNWPCHYLAVETAYRQLANGTLDTYPLVRVPT